MRQVGVAVGELHQVGGESSLAGIGLA
jgi:hypothetical protein